MRKSCTYCGRVHDTAYVCPKKPQKKYKEYTDPENIFRGSAAWKHKRHEIRERDLNICRICYEESGIYNHEDIEIHHITPIVIDYSKRLDNDNLISLCTYHHKLADNGSISADHLRELAVSEVV